MTEPSAMAQQPGLKNAPGRADVSAITEQRWNREAVAARLEEAVDVLARLPEERVSGFYDLWPKLVGEPCTGARRAAAAPEAIDRTDEVLGWLMWLEPEERQLVWLRAEGLPWKWITRRLGVGRTTAWQRWTIALLKITTRLNAAAEQDRSNTKPLNKRADSVLERG
jgi:Domain of unknown function (DUF6362)